jgi:hypothetical protein
MGLVEHPDNPGEPFDERRTGLDHMSFAVATRLSTGLDRQTDVVQFSPDLRERVEDGSITVSYRLWVRPKVKTGGIYRTGSVSIEIDDVELVPFSSIDAEDLALSGEPDLESLRRRAAHAGPIHDDTLLYRIEFHVVG